MEVRAMGSQLKRLAKLFNPWILGLAGVVPLWAVVAHKGRRSGRRYRTPIAIRPSAGGFVIPLPWGPGTDWCRNVMAAQTFEIRWKGADVLVGAPQVIDRAAAAPAFPGLLGRSLVLFGIHQFLAVRRLDTAVRAA
jgi:deazaflavin-dependent oxidoreductase (nitroreductase family)